MRWRQSRRRHRAITGADQRVDRTGHHRPRHRADLRSDDHLRRPHARDSATTTLDPARGLPINASDVNAVTGTIRYDGLGRLTAAWKDSRPTTAKANTQVTYQISNTVPSAVTTQTLNDSVGYATSTALY